MTINLTIQPDPAVALDLSVVGNDVEVTTREEGEYGVVVRLPLPVMRAVLDGLTTEEESDGSGTPTDEDHGGPVDETVEFWQARWKEAAERADVRDVAAHLWKETTRRAVHGGNRWRSLAESGVRITAEVAAHRDQMRTRAEKAEGHLRDRTVDLVEAVAERDKARRERDHVAEESKARAESIMEQQKMIDRLRAGQPRPLAPDDITDRFVDHVHEDYFWSTEERVRLDKPALRNALRDAVKRSQEPTRPEGAEAVSSVLGALREDDGEWMTYASDEDLASLADALAERGVRVTGAES